MRWHGIRVLGAIRSINDLDADDSRRTNPRFTGENFQRNLDVADEVGTLAREIGATPRGGRAGVAARAGEDVVPIPGTEKVSRPEETVAADDVQLTPDQR